ncbi:MAG: hypothetical protein IKT42_00115 [Clostridia bacterium]|nr:hypothetical protein [Clostridia bacterium]
MRNVGFKILYLVTVLVMVVELGFTVKNSIFTNIADVPTGTFVESYPCDSCEKKMNVYLVKNNLGTAIRGEIESNGQKHNIFWQTGIESVDVVWINEDTILINEIPLDVNDTFGYDCRRGYSLFDDGSLEENFTNFSR